MKDWMKEFEDLFQDSDYVDRRDGCWCVDGFVDDEKLKNFIDLVKAEERASLRHDMIVKMHAWHGTGLAMINDYFKRLTKKD